MKRTILFFILITCHLLIADIPQEPSFDSGNYQPITIYPIEEPKVDPIKTYPYVSNALIIPGVGVSMRKNDQVAIDIDVHSLLLINTIAGTYSKLHYFNNSAKRSYLSVGAGMMGMIQWGPSGIGPTFPLRIGLESEYGFIDVGLQAALLLCDASLGGGIHYPNEHGNRWQPWALPELRMGFSF